MLSPSLLPDIHPGEVLLEDFLHPLDLSQNALAIALRIPATRISEIVRGTRAVTADTAMRLGRYFGTTPQFWLNLQQAYDLGVAARALGAGLDDVAVRTPDAQAMDEPTWATRTTALLPMGYAPSRSSSPLRLVAREDASAANDHAAALALAA